MGYTELFEHDMTSISLKPDVNLKKKLIPFSGKSIFRTVAIFIPRRLS